MKMHVDAESVGREPEMRPADSTPAHTLGHVMAIESLLASRVPFMVGGAHTLAAYGGIARDTKDLDVFCEPEHCATILQVLSDAGFHTEMTDPLWLAKATAPDLLIDVIFNSGNGICEVDESWFEHAREGNVLGYCVRLVPPEETIWVKCYVQERDRSDGADVMHMIRQSGRWLDWRRLLRRMDEHWQVLLAHLVTFDFVYPSERQAIPDWVRLELRSRLDMLPTQSSERVCRGVLFSRQQYQVDVNEWGYLDPRNRREASADGRRK